MYTAYSTAKIETAPPTYVHKRKGTVLNEVTPSSARFHSFQPLNLLLPATRPARSYSTTAVLNPAHDNTPFMNS
ncbi:hypothetical protein D3C75_1276460 [compost metagenome]